MSINLTKGERIVLTKNSPLTKVFLGCGWETGDDEDIDVDASCVFFGESRDEVAEAVYYGHLESEDGSVQHGGDNLTGTGDGDDEVVVVDLDRLAQIVESLVFVITSYGGHNFNQIKNAFCRLVDAVSGRELARFDMSGTGDHTALVAVRLYRQEGQWKLQAIGEPTSGGTYQDTLDFLRTCY